MFWVLNSGPQAYLASTSLTEPSFQSLFVSRLLGLPETDLEPNNFSKGGGWSRAGPVVTDWKESLDFIWKSQEDFRQVAEVLQNPQLC